MTPLYLLTLQLALVGYVAGVVRLGAWIERQYLLSTGRGKTRG